MSLTTYCNRLDQETSPYLLLHKDNPVHWHPWDEEALALAREVNKPILLSIGYSACHWCHVMARESFDDAETAEVMNTLYVNIKVDREERPDLDAIYQSALANMGQQRGWPLTMFLTPTGEPFNGGTYYPPTARHGSPSFKDVLRANADAFVIDTKQAMKDAVMRVAELGAAAQGANRGEISPEFLNHAAGQILDGMDVVYGGFGMDAKFPQTMLLELLWRAYGRSGHKPFREAVLRTAEHLCLGGICDHLGGGFARYTVDDRWLIPHFEKMLYDNALIISLLILLWRETKSPLFSHCVEQTADWMIREMRTAKGGFAASLAADSDGYDTTAAGEGAFYVWSETDIDSILGDDAPLFKKYYDVTPDGNWGGETILNKTDHPFGKDTEVEETLAQHRQKLFLAREERPRPQRDDKILADWNGLAIASLAEAGATFNRDEWIAAAVDAYAFVHDEMYSGDALRHAYRQGQCTPVSLLDDYANMAHAAISLYEVTGELSYLQQARDWVVIADQHYWDSDGGGYFFTADNAQALVFRIKTAVETATPSGNGMMVSVLARLYALTTEDSYRQRAEATVAAFSAAAQSNFVAMASLLNHSETLSNLLQIVIVNGLAEDETRQFIRMVYESSIPTRLVLRVAPSAVLPEGHPATGKPRLSDKPTVYICAGNTCQPPITTLADLKTALKDLSFSPE